MSRQHINDIVKDKSMKGFIDKLKAWVSLFFAAFQSQTHNDRLNLDYCHQVSENLYLLVSRSLCKPKLSKLWKITHFLIYLIHFKLHHRRPHSPPKNTVSKSFNETPVVNLSYSSNVLNLAYLLGNHTSHTKSLVKKKKKRSAFGSRSRIVFFLHDLQH